MVLKKKTIEDIELKDKNVLVRVDFNVPLDKDGKITDDLRIRAALPTIQYLHDKNAKIILMSHLGRPGGKKNPEESLKPIFEHLKTLVNFPVKFSTDCIGREAETMVENLESGEMLLLENTRFYVEEEKNDKEFAKKLASLADIFVNDAFGTAHRAHASTEGVTHFIPAVAGFLIKKEIDYLENAIDTPERPFVAILGGKKVSDKIKVIKKLLEKVDAILIGGGMAYTFLKYQGYEIGSSILDKDGLEIVKEVLAIAKQKGKKIYLPSDIKVANKFSNDAETKIINISDGIEEGWIGLDVGQKTTQEYIGVIKKAKTVLWNGPLGVFEMETFAEATKKLAIAIADQEDLISIIGGGDTAAAIQSFDLHEKMTHISTGGGASLELLEGKVLPGVAALQDKE